MLGLGLVRSSPQTQLWSRRSNKGLYFAASTTDVGFFIIQVCGAPGALLGPLAAQAASLDGLLLGVGYLLIDSCRA